MKGWSLLKVTHEEYLKQMLKSKKMELEHVEIDHRIAIAEHNVKKKMLYEQINSIERQLDNK
jgi:hypothetical protein